MHSFSFIVIGVWKSNVMALVRRVAVLKKMVKTVAKYVKRITLSFLPFHLLVPFFFRSNGIVSLNVNEIHRVHQMHIYYLCELDESKNKREREKEFILF